ncbi:uncharacterized protein G2W53_039542 [Senna tora]|uniref:Uncharacterized protein n=1 Tax=Senna tora TaxID=362788 RepID=A0A834W689_9FABA|nr:uncharacterized protein G2W53_039542 [Senna tora]
MAGIKIVNHSQTLEYTSFHHETKRRVATIHHCAPCQRRERKSRTKPLPSLHCVTAALRCLPSPQTVDSIKLVQRHNSFSAISVTRGKELQVRGNHKDF